MSNRFKNQEARHLMLTTLVMDPSVRECLRRMLSMGATNIRPDYMLIRKRESNDPDSYHGSQYNRVDDPGTWLGKVNDNLGVMMIKGPDGKWFLNGY